MAWETALDRLILRQIHLAEEGSIKDHEVRALIGDVAALIGGRPQSWFHAGYARTLLGLDLPEPGSGAQHRGHRRWFAFGRLEGHIRRGEASWVADLSEDRDLVLDLLVEPAIASQVLPALMRSYFQEGDLERAVCTLEMMEAQLAPAGQGDACAAEAGVLIEAALIDLLARVERRPIPAEEQGGLRRALDRAMRMDHFGRLGSTDRARFCRALARTHLAAGEWEEARGCLDEARELATGDDGIHRSVHLLAGLARLHVLDLGQLRPEAERAEREAAIDLLDVAATAPKPLPEALYARGILRYEIADFVTAAGDFDGAVRRLRQDPTRDEGLFARARFFLGASLLAGGVREDGRRAARLIDETVGEVEPDVGTFYLVHDALKATDAKVALRFLDSVDLGRGASPENLLLVGLEYQSLGEPERALRAADRVLEIATDLDQRVDALELRLAAHNMQGRREDARSDYFAIRDLLARRGAFDDLAKTLADEALVGQALDHLEIKSELADVYEEMEGKEWERAKLKVALARAFRARKEAADLRQALGILQEVGLDYPELAQEDLRNVEKLLALKEPARAEGPGSPMDGLADRLGRRPSVLVVGGNERQRKHHPRLEALARDWDFEAEWIPANYSSPQKVVAQVAERLDRGTDLLILLHWNRHETTEPALEKARQAGVPARTLFYAGFTSLQVCLEEMGRRLATQAPAGR